MLLLNILVKPAGASPAKIYKGSDGFPNDSRTAPTSNSITSPHSGRGDAREGYGNASDEGGQSKGGGGRRRGRDREVLRGLGGGDDGEEVGTGGSSGGGAGVGAGTASSWGARARIAWNSLSPTRRLFVGGALVPRVVASVTCVAVRGWCVPASRCCLCNVRAACC